MKTFRVFLLLFCAITTSTSDDAKPEVPEDLGTRIINGAQAALGQFPWQAALFFEQGPGSRFWLCSGTIIDKEWILTAGHCANSAESVLVYTGIIDISQEITPTAISKEFLLHEDFNSDSLANDVALIKLPQALTFDDNTKTIQLSSDKIEAGTTIIVSGWGKTSSNSTNISPLLNYVNLTTISNEQCQDAYGITGLILPEMVCATTSSDLLQTPCHGDSGGPVVIDVDKDPRHVAIASFVSDTGCETGFPSGYTRTASYLDWIKEKTGI